MKQMTCEMCNGTDFMKQDGNFVCQGCGMKYTPEDAKGLMVEVPDDQIVPKAPKKDEELENLYTLARRARDANNKGMATKYYDMILLKDPGSWEASFYLVYFKAMECKIIEIASAADNLASCVTTTYQLISEIKDAEIRKNAAREVKEKADSLAEMLRNAADAHYDGIDLSIRDRYRNELLQRRSATARVKVAIGDSLCTYFAADALVMRDFGVSYLKMRRTESRTEERNKRYEEVILKYEPSYQPPAPPSTSSSGCGCYVATAVYGSYDCPQVWTLRRYRDETLAATWYGRAFIKTYYAISPTLVKWFGDTQWFRKMWQGKLDKMVKDLQDKGVESTPYEDKNW